MEQTVYLALLLSFCTTVSLAQDANPAPTPVPQQREKGGAAEDTVYKEDEVDVKAKLEGEAKVKVKGVNKDLIRWNGCPTTGEATLTIIIHKSGKVTGVTLVKGSGCRNFDKRAMTDARKLKFTPALKDGQPVSQEAAINTGYVWPRGKN